MLNIYVISLEQDVNKRNKISEILTSYGLKYHFVNAIYGKNLSEQERQFHIEKSTGKILDRGFMPTPGEIGCTLSHMKAYEQIVNTGDEWACILEDDVILDQRFQKFIREFDCNGIVMDPQSIYLLGGQEGLFESRRIVKSIRNVFNIGGQNFYKTIKSERVIFRTCCYVLNINLAKKLLSFYSRKFILADDWNHLVKNEIVNKLYLADFVAHPIDLKDSLIETERVKAYSLALKGNFISNLFNKIKSLLETFKRIFLKIYVLFFEKKDKY